MITNRNKKVGNSFETELCEILANHGFWAHNMAANQAGQPADVIAARNSVSYLIDCKSCTTAKGFSLDRVEDNQDMAMRLWRDCGNGEGWFAIKLANGEIYMVQHSVVMTFCYVQSAMRPTDVVSNGLSLSQWVARCK